MPPYEKSKNEVFQCLSVNNMSIAEPKTGVITDKARNISKTVIDINGIKTLLFLNPDILKDLLVTNKFTKLIVVLIPA